MMSPSLVVACKIVTVESVMLIAVRNASSVSSADGRSPPSPISTRSSTTNSVSAVRTWPSTSRITPGSID
jgi:hypothetical protein